jgi:hypothetical protein
MVPFCAISFGVPTVASFQVGPTMEDREARLRLSTLGERAVEEDRTLAWPWIELFRLFQAHEPGGGAIAAALGRLSLVGAQVTRMQSPGAAAQEQSGETSAAKAAQTVPRLPGQAQTAPAAAIPTATPPVWPLPPSVL